MARCAPPGGGGGGAQSNGRKSWPNCSTLSRQGTRPVEKRSVVVARGKIAFDGYLNHLKRHGILIAPALATISDT